MPTANSIHIDAPATNVAIRHLSPEERLTRVFKILPPSKKKSGVYFIYDEHPQRSNSAIKIGPETDIPRGSFTLSNEKWEAEARAWGTTVSDEFRDNADNPINLEVDASRLVTDKVVLKMEIDIADILRNASNWTGTIDLSVGAAQWQSAAGVLGGDPLKVIDNAIDSVADQISIEPNIAVITSKTLRILRKHPVLQPFISGGATKDNDSMATIAVLRQLFGIQEWVVVPTIYISSNEGEPEVKTNIMGAGHDMWIGYTSPEASILRPSAGYVWTWKNRMVKTYREEKNRRNVFEGMRYYDIKPTWADSGYLIQNTVG